jgi:hypothetical protein
VFLDKKFSILILEELTGEESGLGKSRWWGQEAAPSSLALSIEEGHRFKD